MEENQKNSDQSASPEENNPPASEPKQENPSIQTKGSLREKLKRFFLFLLPLALAFVFMAYLIKTRPSSEKNDDRDPPPTVRVLKIKAVTVQKIALGYGRVEPVREWKGYSEVKGKVLALGFSLLRPKDVRDFPKLISSLQKGEGPLAAYLMGQFSSSLQERLQKFKGKEIPFALKSSLLFGLNQVIFQGDLSPFLKSLPTPLNKEIQDILLKDPRRNQRIYFNRKVLERVYSAAFESFQPHTIERGHFLPRGAVICQIDPIEYYLFMEQREISIEQSLIQIRELKQETINLQKTLEIQKDRAKIFKGEYERKKKEYSQKATSLSEVEQQLSNYLQQQNSIATIQNSLNLIPIKIKNLEAAVRMARSQLFQARLDLAKTVVEAPFDLRITSKNIEVNQPVTPGQILIEGYGIEAVHVVGQFQIKDMKDQVFPSHFKFNFSQFLHGGPQNQFESFALRGMAHLPIPGPKEKELVWKGKVTGIRSSIDPTSQTLAVVITVKDPYKKAFPGVRPPLVPGMYCKVTLLGREIPSLFAIPRSAYYSGQVYLLQKGILKIQKVELLFFQGDYALIQRGIQEGDRVILSDIFPAIPGLPLGELDVTDEIRESYPWFIHSSSSKGGKK